MTPRTLSSPRRRRNSGAVRPRARTLASGDRMTTLARLTAAALFAALAACNTVRGVGQDLQLGGATIADTADQAQQSTF